MFYNLILAACICLINPVAREHLSYSTSVKLEGKIAARTYYGAPNFDSKSQKDYVYVLKLSKPVDVIGTPGADFNDESFRNVSLLQVLAKEDLKPFLGKAVAVEGTLSQAMTGHDHTHVILDIEHIQLRSPH